MSVQYNGKGQQEHAEALEKLRMFLSSIIRIL